MIIWFWRERRAAPYHSPPCRLRHFRCTCWRHGFIRVFYPSVHRMLTCAQHSVCCVSYCSMPASRRAFTVMALFECFLGSEVSQLSYIWLIINVVSLCPLSVLPYALFLRIVIIPGAFLLCRYVSFRRF